MKKLLVIFLMLSSSLMTAQNVPFLNVSPDPVITATGGVSVIGENSPYIMTDNPAMMSFTDSKVYTGLSYGMWQPMLAPVSITGLAAYGKINDRFSIGIDMNMFIEPSYVLMDETGMSDGKYRPLEYSLKAGFSYLILEGFSVGINMGYAGSQLAPSYRKDMFIMDLSLAYRVKGFLLSLTCADLGSVRSMPSALKTGFGYECLLNQVHSVKAAVQADWFFTLRDAVGIGTGIEYAYNDFLFARAGYHWGDETKIVPPYVSLGLGCKYAGIGIDLSYIVFDNDSPVRNSFNIALSWKL